MGLRQMAAADVHLQRVEHELGQRQGRIALVPALAVLLALGWWQVERLTWKTALIQELEIRGNAPAIPLPTDPRIPTGDLLFRKVVVTGSYVHEAEMHLLNRVRKGVPGFNLFTPLVLDNNAGTILVNRLISGKSVRPRNWSGSIDS